MIQIFLAHASEDQSAVIDLYNRLKAKGFKPWLDKVDLLPGQNWRAEIPKAIRKSDIVIACLSNLSVKKQGYIQREFRMALNEVADSPPGKVYLIPLRLDNCQIPLLRPEGYGINLADYVWIDLFEPNGFDRLVKSIDYHFPYDRSLENSPNATKQNPLNSIFNFFNTTKPLLNTPIAGNSNLIAQARPLNEAKLILVGFGAVGKTSLVKRLVHKKFDKYEKKTEGIQITSWPLQLPNKEDIRLHIWDFGGQEIMHSTHQFFLTERSLYLLVLNGRQGHEDADADYWLNLIKSFGADSSVIVVLNKIQEHPFNVNRRALQQKYPIREFIFTDCEDGTGIEQLYQTILHEIERLKDLRVPFSQSWFSIKDRLAGMREDYLTFERYRQICRENGENDPQQQDKLSGYLHRLGIALNYKEDPRLQDTHILNPHWVTEGIYALLNAEVLVTQKGELLVGDLAYILDAIKYPPERHNLLLELMHKFELCFRFPEDDCRYLIPEQLDKQQPSEAEEFKPEECLNFQYHYPTLPEGLLPRFIVRSHILSRDLSRWRTGVILEKEGNRALVKADIQDRKVIISIMGPVASRRRLLAIIRSDFEHIHSSFKFQVEEMVPTPHDPNALTSYSDLSVMEQNGLSTFHKVSGNDVLELSVQELLNGVDIEMSQRRASVSKQSEIARQSLNLFYSYSHKDETFKDELETHLKLLQRQGLIAQWSDRQIGAGVEWAKEIDENLENADVILLLVSADFIASDYCYDIEMKRALERHESEEARVVPVILRNVHWHSAPFGKLKAVPKDGKAVTTWGDRDTAWKNVEEEIREIAKGIIKKLE
ncbi:small gtp-binding protein [Leptolyngbya sp. Heron Island J]|uniref:TIR domain-containing protein n=1 Tax=Leptolyngbya sp. Heron Island J TaxID=1385935 RepID=UPI0003B93E75|nr:COR domain-containing protein [Leptolyngbya sp. Heron Island J]ESA35951.1 small gtp-binding protein [Leptolyngbya sp. Heron Island J]